MDIFKINAYALYCVIFLVFFIILLPFPYFIPLIILQWCFIIIQFICLFIFIKSMKGGLKNGNKRNTNKQN